jgi:hypothetical protein
MISAKHSGRHLVPAAVLCGEQRRTLANHPLNLTLRFFLEIAALLALGNWGWTQHTGLARYVLAFGLPLLAATLWGVFRVPGYPGRAPVAVPGPVRLLLEAVFFGGAIWALAAAQRPAWAAIFGGLVLLHYLASYDYILALLRRR